MNTRNKGQPAKEILMKKLGRLTFGKMLRAIRLGEGETQKEFSAKLDMSKQQLSDIENDRKSVSPQSAAAYADMLGYSVDQFIKLSIQDNLAKYGLYYRVDLMRENCTNF